MVALALGFSSFTAGAMTLRLLRIGGGLFLVWLGAQEVRALRADAVRVVPTRAMGPTLRGIMGVVVNPGAWIFFATTAASVVARASADAAVGTALPDRAGRGARRRRSGFRGTGSLEAFEQILQR